MWYVSFICIRLSNQVLATPIFLLLIICLKGLDSHKNIALTLCREICDRPNNKMTPVYLRSLLHLTVPSQDEVAICDLRKQVDLMFEVFFPYL